MRERLQEFAVDAWSPDGRYVAGTSGWPWTIRVYDLEAGEFVEAAPVKLDPEYDMSWMPDNRRLLFWSGEQQRFVTWRFRTGEVEPLAGLDSPSGSARVSPDGRTLYVLEDDIDGEIWMLTLSRLGGDPGS